ncbi:hypothetical protein ACFVWN_17155 [Nocardiopsis flavescens]|uniref:hypothetical protein n=1 Tax=Nocardiopsis flavescens TaxID=758803 RepID=UPI0015B89D4D|nr:hypothetical protein [Nocardiopsis flavescens]
MRVQLIIGLDHPGFVTIDTEDGLESVVRIPACEGPHLDGPERFIHYLQALVACL